MINENLHFLKPVTANIPGELKSVPQWVVWRAESRDGKITKVPYNARTHQKAKSNNPKTWGDYVRLL